MDSPMTSLWTKPFPTMPHYWSSSCEDLDRRKATSQPLKTRAASTEVVSPSFPRPPPPTATMSAMVSSSSVSSVQETSDGDSSHTSSSFAPCDIGLLERLIRTHPIWFLPGIGRAGAIHLLQGKDVGNFIVRQSSKPNTMALSVRLPENKGPYVEHYLIETVGDAQLRLEGSDNNFHAIPMLVAHYCQCCDELPVQLSLPSSLAQAGSRQELSSLALLGQDFWLSSLVQSPSAVPSTGPFPNSAPTENPPHSTFKPTVQAKNGLASPTSATFGTNDQPGGEVHTPSSGSPPPPIAPKHQVQGAPPPPPPRSFMTAKSSCANIPSSPPANSDSSPNLLSPSNPSDSDQAECTTTDAEKLENNNDEMENDSSDNRVDKKIPRVNHYMQSDIVDLPLMYYKSSLADKMSDYEDIWGNTIKDGERKPKSRTFHGNESDFMNNLKHKNLEFLNHQQAEKLGMRELKYMATQGTQTEVHSSMNSDMHNGAMHINNGDVFDDPQMQNIDSYRVEKEYDDETANFSSPYYSQPVDTVTLDESNAFSSPLPQMLFKHRFSDPNLHWPQNASCRIIDTLDEERLTSLSSSVDNLKGLGPSPHYRKQQHNIAMSTQWVQELNQRISTNSLKKDGETQVSLQDLSSVKPEPIHASTPQKIKGRLPNASWQLDSSWEWLAHGDSSDEEIPSGTLDTRFPLHIRSRYIEGHPGNDSTVERIITLHSPELALPEISPLTQSNVMRASEYDNLGSVPEPARDVEKLRLSDTTDDTGTEFSEPWDSLRWERLLRLVLPETDILGDDDTVQREKMENQKNFMLEENKKNQREMVSEQVGFEDESNSTVSAYSDATSEGIDDTSASEYPTMSFDRDRNKSFQERLEPLLAVQRVVALRNRSTSRIGENIRHYIFRLADERNNTFAMSIENFIQCTTESNETNPAVVMRNIRQFMSGMKNYLVKHGEGSFENHVQEERSKLKCDKFLNIDAIIEDSLRKLVIKPLKGFIYQLFVNEYTRNGSLKVLSDNIKFARTKTPEELGVRPEFKPPEGASLEVVNHFLNRLQQAYSPLKKLENLLAAISTIYNSVQQDKLSQGKEHVSLGAGDFLPIFICVLVRCGFIAAEIEADYMWGLLQPSLMAGEGGYYLTTLSSAVHVLKSLQVCSPESSQNMTSFDSLAGAGCSGRGYGPDVVGPRALGCKTPSPEPRLASIADLQGFLKIMIPDELTGSIISKTLPIKPNMTTKEVGKLIAHKFNVTNPQDYGLFKLVNGEETLLSDVDCPQIIKADFLAIGIDCLFIYKRCDAKFIWPMMEKF